LNVVERTTVQSPTDRKGGILWKKAWGKQADLPRETRGEISDAIPGSHQTYIQANMRPQGNSKEPRGLVSTWKSHREFGEPAR